MHACIRLHFMHVDCYALPLSRCSASSAHAIECSAHAVCAHEDRSFSNAVTSQTVFETKWTVKCRVADRMRMQTDDVSGQVRPVTAIVTTEELLRRYRRRHNVALRDKLVERHRGLVESMAHRLALRLPPSVDAQDLVHAGIWGLIQAIDKYEPERCDQFLGFMRIRVRGAMLDELRTMDWLPRLCRRRLREREDALSRLRTVLSREPDEHELAAELGVSIERLQRDYQTRLERKAQVPASPFDEDGSEDDAMDRLPDEGVESPIESIHRQEILIKIRQSLDPIEWKVLQLHYLEGMSGKEVAKRLRLSAARICQIHGRVLDRLKNRLAALAV